MKVNQNFWFGEISNRRMLCEYLRRDGNDMDFRSVELATYLGTLVTNNTGIRYWMNKGTRAFYSMGKIFKSTQVSPKAKL